MAPVYKFTYFNARSLAEVTRLIFAAAEVEYEDERLTRAQWDTIKETSLMGQMPLLEVDGQVMCQSLAIARYVARETGLTGKTSWEEGQVDMFVCGVNDLLYKTIYIYRENDETKKEERKKDLAAYVPNFLDNFEKLCGPDGHLVGTTLTYADLALFAGLDDILKERADVLEKYPKLAKVVESVRANKGVAAYLSERPDTSV